MNGSGRSRVRVTSGQLLAVWIIRKRGAYLVQCADHSVIPLAARVVRRRVAVLWYE